MVFMRFMVQAFSRPNGTTTLSRSGPHPHPGSPSENGTLKTENDRRSRLLPDLDDHHLDVIVGQAGVDGLHAFEIIDGADTHAMPAPAVLDGDRLDA